MRKSKYQGLYKPKNPSKYVGNSDNIVFRSLWELNVMEYLDKHPDVIQWASEELAIPYLSPVDGRMHRYFPDFIAKLKTKTNKIETVMIEVKPLQQTLPPDTSRKKTKRLYEEIKTYAVNQAKFEAAKEYCSKLGWRFEIVTENDLKLN